MLEHTMIDRYLDEVDGYLHLDRAHRQRVLDEIEGHLHDAAEAHIAKGASPHEAMQRAIEEVGPPAEVASQFSPVPSPSRVVRGWRRWTPIVLPAVVLAAGVMLSAWHLFQLRHGITRGLETALWLTLVPTAVAGTLTVATYVAVRNGDHDPAWRRIAWLFAALSAVVLLASITV